MMKITDARQKIILRKLQRTSQKTQKLTDAREILKQKRKHASASKQSLNKPISPSVRSDNFRKQSFQPYNHTRPFSNFKRKKELVDKSGKKVSLRDGMITVTARQNIRGGSSPAKSVRPTDKEIVATDTGIPVVKVTNSRLLQRTPTLATREERMDVDMDEPPMYEYQRPVHSSPSHLEFQKHTPPKVDLRSSISRQQFPLSEIPYSESSRTHQASVVSPPLSHTSSVLVTNLHPSVSEDDILELFSDIGAIRTTRFLQPGTAVIYYLRKADAEKACLAYHNRLLDGLPMQCTILPETSSTKLSLMPKPNIHDTYKQPSLDASPPEIGSVRQSRSPYNIRTPQKPVKFTVRLP